MSSHFGMMVALARWGFKVVPRLVQSHDHGACMLYMDGDGVRAETIHGKEVLKLTWEEFDRGGKNG